MGSFTTLRLRLLRLVSAKHSTNRNCIKQFSTTQILPIENNLENEKRIHFIEMYQFCSGKYVILASDYNFHIVVRECKWFFKFSTTEEDAVSKYPREFNLKISGVKLKRKITRTQKHRKYAKYWTPKWTCFCNTKTPRRRADAQIMSCDVGTDPFHVLYHQSETRPFYAFALWAWLVSYSGSLRTTTFCTIPLFWRGEELTLSILIVLAFR